MSFPGLGCSLSDITPLYMPWIEENGQLRPPFSKAAAMLSLELASTAYDMNPDRWRAAGWRDISYQVDNTLLTGPGVNGSPEGPVSPIGSVLSDYYKMLVKSRLNRQNPISQIRGTLRQREGSDTCKAVVMLHPIPGGRYLVAVGFMGTGKRFYDWISNFRVGREEGVHSGFLQLTRQFEANYSHITFPETARELGLDSLTLADVLAECRRPGSRFLLWMAGHSQGGAIMQLIALREINRGFLRQNMVGYTFASPSAVYDPPACDVSAFPLYHIINTDDVFTRTGAKLHIGRCRVLTPDGAMRQRCYGAVYDQPLFRDLLGLTRNVTCTGDAFLFLLAVLLAMQEISQEDASAVLKGFIGSLIPEKLLPAFTARSEDWLRGLIGRVRRGYALATGREEPPREKLMMILKHVRALLNAYGVRAFSKEFFSALSYPHKLRGELVGNGTAPYQFIVTERFDRLRHKIWCAPANRMEDGRRSPRKRKNTRETRKVRRKTT